MSTTYINMTESQFRTFRADVRRAARDEIRSMRHEIQNELFQGLVSEARSVAAATARKDLSRLNLENQELRATLRKLSSKIEDLESRSPALEQAQEPQPTLKIVDGRIVGMSTPGWEPVNSKNGDSLLMNGERFIFWWGEWRRPSELKGFASWMAKRATAPRQ